MKSPLSRFLIAGLVAVAAFAENGSAKPTESTKPPTQTSAEGQPEKTEAALQGLKQEFQSVSEFEQAAKKAETAGISRQTIDEMRLIVCIKTRSFEPLPDAIARLETGMNSWKDSDSLAFRSKRELEAVMFLGKSFLADQANDDPAFEKAVKEAFWRDPNLGGLLGEQITRRRKKETMASVVLPLDIKLEKASGNAASLRDLMQGQKAVLLDFWASWCGPCMQSMDELTKRAHTLLPQHVAVVGMNTESSDKGGPAEAKKAAQKVQSSKKIDFPWVLEPADHPFSKALQIDSIPRAVLVSPDGKVLYDGHPDDPELVAALQKIGAKL